MRNMWRDSKAHKKPIKADGLDTGCCGWWILSGLPLLKKSTNETTATYGMRLHGSIDQFDRDSTMPDFKAGKVQLLIATSVASRGLDGKDLILVINYDYHYEDYVHRCGRTGRAGHKGFAWTFLTVDQGRYAGRNKPINWHAD